MSPHAFALALAATGLVCAANSLGETETLLDSIFDEVNAICLGEDDGDLCISSVNEMRKNPKYQNPEQQFQIAQILVGMRQRHPQALEIALEILTKLSSSYPGQSHYLEMRAWVTFYQNPIDGIIEAKENGFNGTLASLLRLYLKEKLIVQDITSSAIEQFKHRVEENHSVPSVLSSAKFALDIVVEFGEENEATDFLSLARSMIPWNEWREGEWAQAVEASRSSAESATNLLSIYCQTVLLKMDEGQLCSDSINALNKNVPTEFLRNASFAGTANWTLQKIDEQKPRVIGNSRLILEQMVIDAANQGH